MTGEMLYRDKDITITRLDENRVILKTVPHWYHYLFFSFVGLFFSAFLLVGVIILINIAGGVAKGEIGAWYEVVAAFSAVFLWLAFSTVLLWIAAYHMLPKGFLVDNAAKKCTQAYSLFFRREIPFEEIELFETDEVYAPKSSRYVHALYLYRSKWPRRICLYQTSGRAATGALQAKKILQEQIEKSWKLPSEEELKQRKRRPGRRLETIAEWVVGIPIIATVLLLLVILPTLETLWATINLIQMRSSTTGIITQVSTKDTGQTEPLLKYTYTVGGEEYESSRYLPGLLSEYVEDTRQRFREEKYSPGRQVTVYYSPGNPTRACLKYGWPTFPAAFALFLWGMVLIGYGHLRREKNKPYWLLISSAGPALLLSAFGAGLATEGAAIEVSEIHWYVLAFGVLFIVSLLYNLLSRRSREKAGK